MKKALSMVFCAVGHPIAVYILFRLIYPKVEAIHDNFNHDCAALFAVILLIATPIGYFFNLSNIGKKNIFSIREMFMPILFFFGTLICFHFEYSFKGYKDWDTTLFVFWWIIKILLPILNLHIALLPATILKTVNDTISDSNHESPKRTSVTVYTSEKGRKTEVTRKYYHGNRKEVSRKRID